MKLILSLLALTASILLIGGLAGMGQIAQREATQPASKSPQARMYAVAFHADWCMSCKALAPNFKKFKAKHAKAPLLHVKLDLTNDFTKRQSAMMANALGLDKAWKEFGDKTGFVLLVDAKTKKVIGKITSDQSTEQMDKSLMAAMKNMSGSDHPNAEHPDHPASEHPAKEHPGNDHPGGGGKEHPGGGHDHPGGG
jgi:thiol-disulfide isomerase/thioredoxin